ncbi:MAG: hypothetical protein CUN56_01215 [Phototrophicales bacterium]|nr:MAG: hypothetical protein CUN56_01215 [Phototrophicales bacterium]
MIRSISVMLLAVLMITATMMSNSQPQERQVATLEPSFTPEATATPPLTPVPTSAAPGCGVTLPIEIGDSITVRGGISIRALPSVSAPLMELLPRNDYFTVTDGPVCADNYIWWGIRNARLSGWVAERNNALTFIIDYESAEIVCPTPRDLTIGDEIELAYNVRIRREANDSALVLTVAPAGSTALVLSEPVCVNGYNWRRVEVEVVGVLYSGWMAEAERTSGQTLFIEEGPECYPPLGFQIGDLGRVDTHGPPKNLRAAPNTSADILYTLVGAVPLEIIGGPICSGGMNWWQVRILSTFPAEGWLAEGGRPVPYIRAWDQPPIPGEGSRHLP